MPKNMKFPGNMKFFRELTIFSTKFLTHFYEKHSFQKNIFPLFIKEKSVTLNPIVLCKHLSMKGVFNNVIWTSNISNTRRIFMANNSIVWTHLFSCKKRRIVHNLQKNNPVFIVVFFINSIFFSRKFIEYNSKKLHCI